MPGRAARRKGSNGEREIAKLLGGTRVPLSGSAGGEYSGDVVIPILGLGEVKRRRDGFKQLYAWLEGRDWLAVRADRKPWLFVISEEKMMELLQKEAGE